MAKAKPKKRKPRYGTRITRKGSARHIRTRTPTCRLDLLIRRKRHGKIDRSGVGSILINGQWWNLVVIAEPLKGRYGYCEPDLRLLVLGHRAGQLDNNKEFLDTLIHEVSHALDYSRKEKVIHHQGSVLSEIVTAFGYKL